MRDWWRARPTWQKVVIVVVGLGLLGSLLGDPEEDAPTTPVAEAVGDTTTTADITTTTTQATTTTTQATTTTTLPPTTTTTVFDPTAYQELGERDYALFVRNADDRLGERLVVYGHVWQFDNATGPDAFLADTSSVEQDQWFDYEHQALIIGTQELFANVVEDDIFKAYVVGLGSTTYETAIGGSNTVAVFQVQQIEVVGFAD